MSKHQYHFNFRTVDPCTFLKCDPPYQKVVPKSKSYIFLPFKYLNKYWSTCWYDWSQISKLMCFKCTSRCFILLKEKWSVGTITENPVKLVGSPNTKHYIQINEVILHCHQGSHQAFISLYVWKILLLQSYCYSLNVSPDQWMQLMGRRRCVCWNQML